MAVPNTDPAIIKQSLLDTVSEVESVKDYLVGNPGVDFTRNRRFSFSVVLKILLGMRGNTLNAELDTYFDNTEKFATASAFVQQRSKIHPEAFEYLFQKFNKKCSFYDQRNCNGYRLFAVDGSDLNVCYDEKAESFFPNGDNKGFNQLHLNCLYDVLNETYADCFVQPSPKTDEPYAAQFMVERSNLPEKSIILADRGYGSMNLMEHLKREGVDFLIRVKDGWIREVSALPMEEVDKEISFELRQTQTKKDKEDYKDGKAKYISGASKFGKCKESQTWDFELPYRFSVRIVRFKKPDGEYETIATSLNSFEFPAEKLCELYHLRWGIETSFRELKINLALERIHSRKEQCVLQEIYARLTMYNFCQRIAHLVKVETKSSETKYAYEINFTETVNQCVKYFRYCGDEPPNILERIRRYIVPIRPGRSDKRKMKPKSVAPFIYRIA